MADAKATPDSTYWEVGIIEDSKEIGEPARAILSPTWVLAPSKQAAITKALQMAKGQFDPDSLRFYSFNMGESSRAT